MIRRSALLALGCLALPEAISSTAIDAAHETDVQEGYINSLPKSFPKNRTLVISPLSLALSERFREWSSAEDATSKVPILDRVVARNLMAVCNSRVPVSLRANKLNELPRVHLPSAAELSRVLGDGSQDAWANFYKSYPRAIGLTQFSRVGFNTTFDEAAMFVHTKGGGAGDGDGVGEIAILRKTDEKWYTHAWRSLWFD